jgi:plasmid stabilization system protein ParE
LIGLSPEFARRWHGGLISAMDSLAVFPHRHPIASETAPSNPPIHAFVYGRGRSAYRVRYAILEPDADSPPAVRILRVTHASRSSSDQSDES